MSALSYNCSLLLREQSSTTVEHRIIHTQSTPLKLLTRPNPQQSPAGWRSSLHTPSGSMVQPAIEHGHQVVDLISDDDNDGFSDDSVEFHDAHSIVELTDDEMFLDLDEPDQYEQDDIENADIIDLTAIPDIDVPPSEHGASVAEDQVPTNVVGEAELITEAVCLQLVLDVFPDVSIDHVLMMIQERTTDQTRTKDHSERIVNELLEGTYPKEADVASKKRRRADSEEASDYGNDDRHVEAHYSVTA